jgi:hypothetical protein
MTGSLEGMTTDSRDEQPAQPEPAYRASLVHWRVTDPDGRRLVHLVTDRAANRMMVSVDARPIMTIDPVRARALALALAEATYVGLEPTGPWLTLERTDLLGRPVDPAPEAAPDAWWRP